VDHLDRLDQLANLDQGDPQALWDLRDHREDLVSQETGDRPDPPADRDNQDSQDRAAHPAILDHVDLLALQDPVVRPARQDLAAHQAQGDQPELSQDQPDLSDPRVLSAPLDHPDQPAIKAIQDQQDQPGQLDLLDQLDLQDSRDPMAKMAHPASQDHEATRDPQVLAANQDLRDHQDLVLSAPLAPPDQVVLQENRVYQDLRDPMAQPAQAE